MSSCLAPRFGSMPPKGVLSLGRGGAGGACVWLAPARAGQLVP